MTSIVATYAHLLIVAYPRGDVAGTNTGLQLRFNNDTAANYDHQRMTGAGSVVTPVESFAQTSLQAGFFPGNTATANCFGAHCIFVPHYAGSTNNKLALSVSSAKSGVTSGALFANLQGGFWRSSAAINRVTLLPNSGNFVAGTRVTIYGMGS